MTELDSKKKTLLGSFFLADPVENGDSLREVIEFQESQKTKSYLKKCFSSLVNRKEIFIGKDVARHIFTKELQIDLEPLNEPLQNVLLDSLVYLMIVWPGWSKSSSYFDGSLMFNDWFEKLRQYLIFQLNHIIMQEDKYRENIRHETVDKGEMTYVKKQEIKPDSETAIEVCGPPSFLYNLIFYENKSRYYNICPHIVGISRIR